MSRVRTPKPKPRFEKRVWQVGPYDWRWELRDLAKTWGGVEAGRATGPADANRQIRDYINRVEKREKAKWRPVRA